MSFNGELIKSLKIRLRSLKHQAAAVSAAMRALGGTCVLGTWGRSYFARRASLVALWGGSHFLLSVSPRGRSD